MNMKHLAGFASAMALAGAAEAVTAEHFIAASGSQDIPTWFGADYADDEVWVFEGRIGNNSAAGGSQEVNLFQRNPRGSGSFDVKAQNQLSWGTAVSPREWAFSVTFTPADSFNPAKVAYSLTDGTTTINNQWTWTPPPVTPTTLMSDLVIRARAQNSGADADSTGVELTDLAFQVGAGPVEPIINPSTLAADLKVLSDAADPFRRVEVLFLEDVFNGDTETFTLSGKAKLRWSDELTGGSSPIANSALAFEFKVGSFTVIPEGDVLWAMLPLAGAAGFWACRRARRA
jgi:hypothetical protein